VDVLFFEGRNFGWIWLHLKIDGKTAANIVQGRRYDQFVRRASYATCRSCKLSADFEVLKCGRTTYVSRQHGNTDSVVLAPSACLQAATRLNSSPEANRSNVTIPSRFADRTNSTFREFAFSGRPSRALTRGKRTFVLILKFMEKRDCTAAHG